MNSLRAEWKHVRLRVDWLRRLAFDNAGNLFVAIADSIYKFTPEGVRTTFAVRTKWMASACDNAGNLFVATGDTDLYEFPINGSGKIYKFTPAGGQSTFASGLDLPSGLAFDSAGNLFVQRDSLDEVSPVNGAMSINLLRRGCEPPLPPGLLSPEALAFRQRGQSVSGRRRRHRWTSAPPSINSLRVEFEPPLPRGFQCIALVWPWTARAICLSLTAATATSINSRRAACESTFVSGSNHDWRAISPSSQHKRLRHRN